MSLEENSKNFAWDVNFPADVRRDPKLSFAEKVFYCEIRSMCISKNYCWPSNGYLASIMGVSDRTIRTWISNLLENGYINVVFQERPNNEPLRVLYIMDSKFGDGRKNISGGAEENFRTVGNSFPNTHIYNNIYKKNDIKEQIDSIFSFDEFWKMYPNKISKAKCESKYYKLGVAQIQKIKDTLPIFLNYKQFEGYNHPNPLTYLNQQRWDDEIKVLSERTKTKSEVQKQGIVEMLKNGFFEEQASK